MLHVCYVSSTFILNLQVQDVPVADTLSAICMSLTCLLNRAALAMTFGGVFAPCAGFTIFL